MEDLIKRSDAIKALTEVLFDEPPYLNSIEKCEAFARKTLEDIPSAEKQGEWIYCEDDEGQDGYRCSECGFFVPWYYDYEDINYIYKYHACPSCMARMKGADDDSNNI